MKRVRTAKGKFIDMGALAKANENTRAVGNVPINAKGDRLDASGNVVATVQSISRAQHEHSQPTEKRKLSTATNDDADRPQKPVKNKVKAEPSTDIKSRQQKTRDDGSKYIEIEYNDGSMSIEEVKE